MKVIARLSLIVGMILISAASFAIGNSVGTVSAQRQNLRENSEVAQPQRYQVWEYRVVSDSGVVTGEKRLNDMGTQGWELVAVQTSVGSAAMPVQNYSLTEAHYFFKRAKQ